MAPTYEQPIFTVSTPEHFKALAHPLRHRLMFALGEPATVSQLARRLDTRKGNIAHHLKVLTDAGMVHIVETRTVRGGTEQYHQRTAAKIDFAPGAVASTAASLAAVADELNAAADEPLLHLRHIRLTPRRAEELRALLDRSVEDLEPAGEDDSRYGVLVAMYRQREQPES